jgi:ADP-ribosylglycohydrolase
MKKRFAGCLLGQAVGDAMGFIVEGQPPATCLAYVDNVIRPQQFGGCFRGPFPIGQYTDDTQLARELARSCVERHGFDPADYATRIALLFAGGQIVGRGLATEQAACNIANGISWDEAGVPAPSAGNGSAMRSAPIGLLYAHDPEAMIRAAHDQGRITHCDPRCSAGSIAIAGAVAIALNEEGEVDAHSFCHQLSEWTYPYDSSFGEALQSLHSWLSEQPRLILKRIRQVGLEPEYMDDDWEGISPFVTSSVLWSIYSFLRSPDDYWEVICTAISAGGDVDTTAAMSGAIAGTRVGLNGIPKSAKCLITDQGTWGHEELITLAHDLFQLCTNPS